MGEGWFDAEIIASAWFDEELIALAWFDEELITEDGGDPPDPEPEQKYNRVFFHRRRRAA